MTRDKSPYYADDNVLVPNNSQLTVEAGVVVKFAPGKGIDVFGRVDVRGQPGSGTLFTLSDVTKSPGSYNGSGVVQLFEGNTESQGIVFNRI